MLSYDQRSVTCMRFGAIHENAGWCSAPPDSAVSLSGAAGLSSSKVVQRLNLPNRGRLESREPPIVGHEKINPRDCGAS